VPIRTQCFKHKYGFVENEESRRYISTTPELFIPYVFRSKADSVKQGSGGKHYNSFGWLFDYEVTCRQAISLYERMIEDGICPEQARFVLPQGVEVNWVWTGSLAAYARFYNQRTDPHAQLEVQQLACEVGAIVEPLFPLSWKALTNGL
jgi:thymidylate synthase (FAD)